MDLAVDLAGIRLRTPFLIGSGMHTGEGDQFGRWVDLMAAHHWAGLVPKTYLKRADLVMRPYLWTSHQYRRFGMQNAGPNLADWNPAQRRALAENVRTAHAAGLVVIASFMASSLAEWREVAMEITDTGVDGLELNLSCPAAVGAVEAASVAGYHAGQSAEATANIVREVTAATALPVFPKLTPQVASPTAIAQAARENGAAGVSAINTLQGILGVDVDTGVPYCSDVYTNSFKSGLSGPLTRPVGLRIVADLALSLPGLPICGIGGIDDWRGAVEYLMVGAKCVQVCTAVMWRGFKVGSALHAGLEEFMRAKGYAQVADFRGLALSHIQTVSIPAPDAVAVVDVERCNACGLCLVPCREAAYGALSMVEGKLTVDLTTCDGCGLCAVVCQREAIRVRNAPGVRRNRVFGS